MQLFKLVALQEGHQVLFVEAAPALVLVVVFINPVEDIFKEVRVYELRIVRTVEIFSRAVVLLLRVEDTFILARRTRALACGRSVEVVQEHLVLLLGNFVATSSIAAPALILRSFLLLLLGHKDRVVIGHEVVRLERSVLLLVLLLVELLVLAVESLEVRVERVVLRAVAADVLAVLAAHRLRVASGARSRTNAILILVEASALTELVIASAISLRVLLISRVVASLLLFIGLLLERIVLEVVETLLLVDLLLWVKHGRIRHQVVLGRVHHVLLLTHLSRYQNRLLTIALVLQNIVLLIVLLSAAIVRCVRLVCRNPSGWPRW